MNEANRIGREKSLNDAVPAGHGILLKLVDESDRIVGIIMETEVRKPRWTAD